MEPFSCHGKAAAGGFSGESSGDIGESHFEGLAVRSGGGYVLPGDLVLPCPEFLSVAHVGFEKILDCLGFYLGLLNQGLQFSQLLDLAGQFVGDHVFFLSGLGGPVVVRGLAAVGFAAVSRWSFPHPGPLLRGVLGIRFRCPS